MAAHVVSRLLLLAAFRSLFGTTRATIFRYTHARMYVYLGYGCTPRH